MKHLLTLLLFFVFVFGNINAQEKTINSPTTINQQFDNIYRTSTSYQIYKVIGKERFLQLKSNVADSLKTLAKSITQKEQELKTKNAEIVSLKEKQTKITQDLQTAISKEDSISLFGIYLNKGTYNLVLWSLIALLLAGFISFIYKFTNSNILTQQAQDNLVSVEREFDQFRKKSIEREQKLRRELLDEINKHKK